MEPLTNINYIPARPIISRFVAPWDTSGWYSVFPNFTVGKRLYSNSDAYVTFLPEEYSGWEYIMTFDSKTDGFDDKQEVDFYLEQDATVFIALDKSVSIYFFSDFTDTKDELLASNGCAYRILAADYLKGTQVHIPGFTGEAHHFVVFVRPQLQTIQEHIIETISSSTTVSPYIKHKYTWYFHEVFNQSPSGLSPENFVCGGFCQVMSYPHSIQRKYVLLRNGAYLSRSISTSGQEILELSIQIFSGSVDINFCGAKLILKNGHAHLENGQLLAFSDDNSFYIRIERKIIDNTCSDNCIIWINDRIVGRTNCDSGKTTIFSIITDETAIASLDFISLRDNTEIFVASEDFSFLPSNLTLSENATAKITDYPYEINKSLCLTGGSCCYTFAPVTEIITVETKVKAKSDGFVILPELRDSNGQLALRVAMFCNNLYASNGQTWERIFVGDTDWMYYPYNNWYNIRIITYLSTGTYDVYLDGARRVHGFSLMNSIKNIAQIGYYVTEDELYINELRIYDSPTICRDLMPPNKVFDVLKAPYNACGDGSTLDTQSLQRAIDDASCTGGTIYIHDGKFLTGSLNLHSDITIFIDRSAVLIGSQDHNQYPLYTPGNSLCASRQLGRGILYGQNLCNVRITGGGTIDGQGLYRFKMNDPSNNRLPDSRPCMIYLSYSSGITLDDIRFRSSAYWTVVPLSCRNVFMQYLDLDCMKTPNRDGIDPVDCKDMTIRRCNIMAGDDGLCFKSSDTFGCENIDVTDMMIQSLASGIKFGTDTYYSLKNTYIHNCAIKNVNRCGISLESVDGAEVSDVVFDEIDITNTGAPIYITVGIRGRVPRNTSVKRQSSINGVQFKNIRFDNSYPFSFTKNIRENMIIGQSEELPVRNITFSNCYFELPGGFSEIPDIPNPIDEKYPEYDQHGLATGHAFCIRYAENIEIINCTVALEQPDVRPMIGYSDYITK